MLRWHVTAEGPSAKLLPSSKSLMCVAVCWGSGFFSSMVYSQPVYPPLLLHNEFIIWPSLPGARSRTCACLGHCLWVQRGYRGRNGFIMEIPVDSCRSGAASCAENRVTACEYFWFLALWGNSAEGQVGARGCRVHRQDFLCSHILELRQGMPGELSALWAVLLRGSGLLFVPGRGQFIWVANTAACLPWSVCPGYVQSWKLDNVRAEGKVSISVSLYLCPSTSLLPHRSFSQHCMAGKGVPLPCNLGGFPVKGRDASCTL